MSQWALLGLWHEFRSYRRRYEKLTNPAKPGRMGRPGGAGERRSTMMTNTVYRSVEAEVLCYEAISASIKAACPKRSDAECRALTLACMIELMREVLTAEEVEAGWAIVEKDLGNFRR